MTLLGINHGSSVIIGSTFDWNRSSISRLELDAVPHSWIPYAHTGFRIKFSFVSMECASKKTVVVETSKGWANCLTIV